MIVSYRASLDWLKTVPGGVLDLVLYQKHDFRAKERAAVTPQKVLHLLRQEVTCSHGRLHYPQSHGCQLGCRCGPRAPMHQPQLVYFALVPNYGLTHRKPFGGSREPYGYLQYLLDFWDNLPPVIIFSQDDCLARGCAWGNQLPPRGKGEVLPPWAPRH